jgi:tetratricopeptide (TPR) repeat protein
MVLDNANDEKIFYSDSAFAKYIPVILKNSVRSILITTRDKRLGGRLCSGQEPITVLPFEAEYAETLLLVKLPASIDWDEKVAMELIEELDYLSLAIAQAAAYIRPEEGKATLATYLALLRDKAEFDAILEDSLPDSTRDREAHGSVFLTWRNSFEQISRRMPRAAELLSLMAVLYRQSVVDPLVCNKDETKVRFSPAIRTLKDFYLIQGSESYSMHRLVQVSTQKWLKLQGSLVEWQKKALDLIFNCCPSSGKHEHWTDWESINPHVQVVLGYEFRAKRYLLERASILNNAAEYNLFRGEFESAMKMGRESVQICQQLLKIEHQDTLTSMNIVANVLYAQGKYDEAEKLYRQTLQLEEKVMGKEHPNTLHSMNNLALVLNLGGVWRIATKNFVWRSEQGRAQVTKIFVGTPHQLIKIAIISVLFGIVFSLSSTVF